ncbi:MAG: hypothetical protein GEV06_29230 [Luteitalea sp.]|nr:hypothetical protein [Luteitalea sp.]
MFALALVDLVADLGVEPQEESLSRLMALGEHLEVEPALRAALFLAGCVVGVAGAAGMPVDAFVAAQRAEVLRQAGGPPTLV